MLVSGSHVFKAENPKEIISKLSISNIKLNKILDKNSRHLISITD